MNTLLLKIWRVLEPGTHAPKPLQIYGPLFHRWLPDGEKDAIALDVKDPNVKLKVWFERTGFVESGFIRFDYHRKEVDMEVMSRQAILQGGPLFGLMEITDLSDDDLAVVKRGEKGHELYMALGKRVAKKLQPAISKFLNLLKINFGQYWIPDLEPWDSRRESLGGYFAGGFGGLFVEWSIDGKNWENFRPDDPSGTIKSNLGRDFSDYPGRDDWEELKQAAQSDYEPTLAAIALARAHQLKDQGNIRSSVMEAVTALEVALSEFLRTSLDNNRTLLDSIQPFYQSPLRTQLTVLSARNTKVSSADVEDSIKIIDVRNEVAHEGKAPSGQDETRLLRLLRTVAAFLSGPKFRFPRLITDANMLFGPDEKQKESTE